jgi:selenocysteine lyase/cysteine desulfurase
MLAQLLIDGLNEGTYELLNPRHSPARSTLVYVTHRQRDLNESVHRELECAGIDIALRNLRFSPHLYNTAEDIDRALHVLGSLPRTA